MVNDSAAPAMLGGHAWAVMTAARTTRKCLQRALARGERQRSAHIPLYKNGARTLYELLAGLNDTREVRAGTVDVQLETIAIAGGEA